MITEAFIHASRFLLLPSFLYLDTREEVLSYIKTLEISGISVSSANRVRDELHVIYDLESQ